MKTNKKIWKKARDLRFNHGFKLGEISNELNLSPSTISNMVRASSYNRYLIANRHRQTGRGPGVDTNTSTISDIKSVSQQIKDIEGQLNQALSAIINLKKILQ